jgi:hypothetical protein
MTKEKVHIYSVIKGFNNVEYHASTKYYGKRISRGFVESDIFYLIKSKTYGYKKAVKQLRKKIIQENKLNLW